MKKITRTNLNKNLAKYSALTIAIAGIADASGQVVYTDVDPDFVGGAGDSFAIDFNDDGTDDITILQSSIFTRADGTVVGITNAGFYYATNLAEGAVIDAAQSFQTFGDLCYSGGFPNSFCASSGGPTPDGFIGVQFDVSGDTHYGWVSLEAVSSTGFTVTGFAFEATPDTAILAGDGVLSVEDNAIDGFTFFVDANNMLNLKAAGVFNQVSIFNITGQEVMSKNLSSTTEVIDMNSLSTGIYLAKVAVEGRETVIKVVRK